jgi:DNA polymerase-3 subunit gamma/tau
MVKNLRGIAEKEGVTIDDESLHVIASKADGAMRDALTIFDQTVAFCGTNVVYEDVKRNLGVLDYHYSFSIVDAALSGDYATCFKILDEVLAKGFNALHFVGSLSEHLRNLVVAKTGGLEPLLELPDSLKQQYSEQGARTSLAFLYQALGITTACETGYKAAVNPRLHIEFALMKLSFLIQAPEPVAGAKPVATQPVAPQQPADKTAVAPKPAPEIPSPAPQVRNDKPEAPVISSGGEAGVEKSTATPVQPAPERRKRTPKTGSALSMNAIMDEKEEKPQEEETVAVEETLPDSAAVQEAWKALVGKFSDRPRLANALAQAKLREEEGEGVKSVYFSVSNAAQKQWIEEKMLRDLERQFRELLSCHKVNLHVDDIPEEDTGERVPYMPEEKAKVLMDTNPEVRELVAALGLDTK